MKKHEQKIRHFGGNWGSDAPPTVHEDQFHDQLRNLNIHNYMGLGMMRRWDDSQRFLSDHPYLVSEETSKYLMLWCFHLEAEQKRALMEQVAHQAVVMQFIIEIAKNCNVDPRGCFRLFFQKAKTGEGYFEAFKNELEAFKTRVRIWSQSDSFQAILLYNPTINPSLVEQLTSLSQNTGDLQGSINTNVCSLNSVIQRDEEESKMMDTV
ncbi:hsp90 co-chaperone Cdc37-like 1 [Meleagris gallopavo]|uniref:hsp90 co-chaperone Cdc37-like 1 n=1 Tax=Meleagris gallopavo TaxID=9103 RepID=UPI00093A9B01|nr:hsp90 co-chaperone Cdc37-like 1 [Meleagris gallopavo]